ncbi:hypothetical protein H6504_01075 [Candidatus Woesearchaeota archaeon]|nr:hypothetical protein [Candidatus Woesearchaeota archaeon]
MWFWENPENAAKHIEVRLDQLSQRADRLTFLLHKYEHRMEEDAERAERDSLEQPGKRLAYDESETWRLAKELEHIEYQKRKLAAKLKRLQP